MPEPSLFRHYQIVQDSEGNNVELARDSEQVNVLAFDTQQLEFVHCHVLLEPLADRAGFEANGRGLQTSGHPLLARLADFGEDDGNPFYITGNVDGETLQSYLSRQMELPGWLAVMLAGLIGFGGAPWPLQGPGLYLLELGVALVLFEAGGRVPLRWFRHNPWVLLVGVGESIVTFASVYVVTGFFGLTGDVRLVVASLAISASPAGIVRVANELHSAGQVTERVLHLCAINCLMAVLALKLVVGYWHISTTGDLVAAAFGSVHVLGTSVAVGTLLGVAVPWLLRARITPASGVTVVFALAVLLLTTASFGLQLSPLLAALTFGIVARERRVHLTNAQRDFGTVGELLGLFLFVYVASLIEWSDVWGSLALGATLLLVRTASKVLVAGQAMTMPVRGLGLGPLISMIEPEIGWV